MEYKKITVVIGIVLAFLIVAGIFLYTAGDSTPAEDNTTIAKSNNTELYRVLTDIGTHDILVDATKERILIRYNSDINKTGIILNLTVKHSPIESKKIVIQRFENYSIVDKKVISWEKAEQRTYQSSFQESPINVTLD